MNLSQLYYFRKLAQLEHYTKTAQELYISQPSLSSSIAAMEDELQIKLFQKKGRNVRLTKDGREFYGHICRALDALQDGIDSAREKSSALRGSIDIAASSALLLNFVPEMIASYRKAEQSQVQFQLFRGASAGEIADGIEQGTYDFGFCEGAADSESLCAVPVLSQEFAAFVSRSHPLAGKKSVALCDLAGREVMTYDSTTAAGQMLRPILAEQGIPSPAAFADEFTISGAISQNEQLVVIAAKSEILAQCAALTSLPITDLPGDLPSICLVYSRKNHVTKPMERFLSYVTAQYPQ